MKYSLIVIISSISMSIQDKTLRPAHEALAFIACACKPFLKVAIEETGGARCLN